MSHRTKWDKLSGVKALPTREPNGHGPKFLCENHRSGCPPWAIGKRFFNERCVVCEEKAAKDPTLRTAPTVAELFAAYKASRRQSSNRFASQVAARKRARFIGPALAGW
ncbi:MAG TPA: hypothetical protein VJ801_17605 [Polyangia bacterium]|jgi:hypothetical protein|nr:hypothetical protein [Polyangia bacterium]